MKKTLLALAVMAAAGSANAAEVYKTDDASINFYGQLRQYAEISDIDGDDDAKIDKSSSRWGLIVTYNVNDTLSVLGRAEVGVDGSDLRQHYIGFASDTYGTVTFGQHSPLYDDIYGAIYPYQYDMAPYAGDFNTYFWQESSVKYAFANDSVWVKAQYNLPENDKSPEMGEAYVGTSFGDLSMHVGGAYMNNQTETVTSGTVGGADNGPIIQTTTQNDQESAFVLATVEYAVAGGVVGLSYAYNDQDDKAGSNDVTSNSWHLGAKIPVAEKTSLYGQYQYWDFDGDTDETQNVVLGAEYKFSSWAIAYAEYNYRSQQKTDDAEKDWNKVALGARVYW